VTHVTAPYKLSYYYYYYFFIKKLPTYPQINPNPNPIIIIIIIFISSSHDLSRRLLV